MHVLKYYLIDLLATSSEDSRGGILLADIYLSPVEPTFI